VRGLQPGGGWTQRAGGALVFLLLISFGAHLAYEWLAPLIPVLCALVGMVVLYAVLFRRW
jgi:CHASE2 domain-containing sensor protein